MYAAVGFGANSAVKIIARMLQEYKKQLKRKYRTKNRRTSKSKKSVK